MAPVHMEPQGKGEWGVEWGSAVGESDVGCWTSEEVTHVLKGLLLPVVKFRRGAPPARLLPARFLPRWYKRSQSEIRVDLILESPCPLVLAGFVE